MLRLISAVLMLIAVTLFAAPSARPEDKASEKKDDPKCLCENSMLGPYNGL